MSLNEVEFEKTLNSTEREAWRKIERVFDSFKSNEGGGLDAGVFLLDTLGEILGPLTEAEQLDLVTNGGLWRLKERCETHDGVRPGLTDQILSGGYAATFMFGEAVERGGAVGILLLNMVFERKPEVLENTLPGISEALKELGGKIAVLKIEGEVK